MHVQYGEHFLEYSGTKNYYFLSKAFKLSLAFDTVISYLITWL